MKISTITEVLELEAGQTVLATCGVIDAIFPYKTGSNSVGEYTLQNLMVKDGLTGKKIKVKLDGREAVPKTAKGRKIWLQSVKGDKGWHGLLIKDEEYQGKEQKVIHVKEAAELSFADPATGEEPPPAEAPRSRFKQPDPEPDQEHEPGHEAPQGQAPAANGKNPNGTAKLTYEQERHKACQEAVTKARHGLGQAANAYWLAILAGDYTFRRYKEKFGEAMTDAQFQGMVSSLFIHMTRTNLLDGLPHGDLAPFMPKPKSTTETPA